MLKALIAAAALFLWSGGADVDASSFDFYFSVVAASGPFWISVVLHSGSDYSFSDWEQPALEFLIALSVIFFLGGAIGYGVTAGCVHLLEKNDVTVGLLVTKGWVIALYCAFIAMGFIALVLVRIKKKLLS